ncbi:DMT family transporter [Pseudarthrobacter sp. J1738]|uniref:DMT family transporter n=1 Tax=unclassified Pseudarthrobacter TaxID=2647000 RepID=UPI003D2CED54
MTSRTQIPVTLGLPLAIVAGLAVPVQGRINGALGQRLHDGLAAAVVSFTTGLIVMIVVSLVEPSAKAGAKRIIPALKARSFPPLYAMAGAIGGFFVVSQSFTVGLIGIALFTVAVVTGQSLSGLIVDRLGIGPAGRRSITVMRVLGTLLMIASVIFAVSPRLGSNHGVGALVLPMLFALSAGFLMSFQQAMNGTATLHYGTPLAATLVNFIAGTVVLWIIWGVKVAVSGVGAGLPSEWWYYLGGPMGCIFIALSATLVRSIGVLLTGLGMIAGQLIGSLFLDLTFPSPGTVITLATVAGTILTLIAMVVATLPWPRGALSKRL